MMCAILSLHTSTLHARPRSSTYPSRFHAMLEVGCVRRYSVLPKDPWFYSIYYVEGYKVLILLSLCAGLELQLYQAQIRSMPLMVAGNAHSSTHSVPIFVSLRDSTKLVQPLSGKDMIMLSVPQGHFCKPRSLDYKL